MQQIERNIRSDVKMALLKLAIDIARVRENQQKQMLLADQIMKLDDNNYMKEKMYKEMYKNHSIVSQATDEYHYRYQVSSYLHENLLQSIEHEQILGNINQEDADRLTAFVEQYGIALRRANDNFFAAQEDYKTKMKTVADNMDSKNVDMSQSNPEPEPEPLHEITGLKKFTPDLGAKVVTVQKTPPQDEIKSLKDIESMFDAENIKKGVNISTPQRQSPQQMFEKVLNAHNNAFLSGVKQSIIDPMREAIVTGALRGYVKTAMDRIETGKNNSFSRGAEALAKVKESGLRFGLSAISMVRNITLNVLDKTKQIMKFGEGTSYAVFGGTSRILQKHGNNIKMASVGIACLGFAATHFGLPHIHSTLASVNPQDANHVMSNVAEETMKSYPANAPMPSQIAPMPDAIHPDAVHTNTIAEAAKITHHANTHPSNNVDTHPSNHVKAQSGNHADTHPSNHVKAQSGNHADAHPSNHVKAQSGNHADAHPSNHVKAQSGNHADAHPQEQKTVIQKAGHQVQKSFESAGKKADEVNAHIHEKTKPVVEHVHKIAHKISGKVLNFLGWNNDKDVTPAPSAPTHTHTHKV